MRQSKRSSKKKTKILMVSAVAASSVAGVPAFGGIDKAEAATMHTWDQYSITENRVQKEQWFTMTNLGDAQTFAGQVGSYVEYHGESVVVRYTEIERVRVYVGKVSSTNRYAYPDGDLYVYTGSYETNQAPSTPTLTVPSQQFEHGDTQIIGWQVSDPNGDPLIHTLQAAYDGTSNWETIYSGPNKSCNYTVPTNKTNVKFRVISSDGQLTATSTETVPKNIREVMYKWAKYKAIMNTQEIMTLSNKDSGHHGNESAGPSYPQGNTGYTRDGNLFLLAGNVTVGSDRFPNPIYQLSSDRKTLTKIKNFQTVPSSNQFTYDVEQYIIGTSGSYVRDQFLEYLEGGYNSYQHGVRNADGYWYERGQRVLSADITPPIIELAEQENYGATSTITVKTHDLGAVSKVKWLKGSHAISTFQTQGTDITNQNSFTVNENGTYTVYAEDAAGNKAVQTIDIVKVNTAPTKPTLKIPEQQFEHDDKQILSWNSTDAQGQPITYTLKVSYDEGATYEEIYVGTNRTFEYTVPKDKGSKTQFSVVASDGILDSEVTVSAPKSIREVMYYWSKYANSASSGYSQGSWVNSGTSSSISGFYNTSYSFNANSGTFTGIGSAEVNNPYVAGTWYSASGNTVTRYQSNGSGLVTISRLTSTYYSNESKGSLIQSNIEAGFSTYNNGVKNPDGFWYIRGQRVLSEDVTPPIIELQEQTEYGDTSTITVKTHDLGNVKTVKWAEGEQDISFFTTQGTSISTGQSSPSEFTVNKNGKYSVYAIDDKGNADVQIIDVVKVNLPAEVDAIYTDSFTVADNSTSISIEGNYTDREDQDVTVNVYLNDNKVGTGSGSKGRFVATGNASSLEDGIYLNPFSLSLHDGAIEGSKVDTTDHILIKVKATDEYTRLLNGHTSEANKFDSGQHQAFYDANLAVLKYETDNSKENHMAALGALTNLNLKTGISNSDTISEWTERIEVVFAEAALSKSEASLDKSDYEEVVELHSNLTLQTNKDLLQSRLDELEKYHEASDLLVPMETEVARHKANTSSVLDTSIINTANFVSVRTLVNLTSDKTEAQYNTVLTQRLKDLQAYYLNNKDGLTPDDIKDLFPDIVDPDITTEYEELKGAFQPIAENLEHLIKYTNALVNFLRNVDQTSKDNYISVIQDLPRDTGIDFAELAKVTTAVESIYAYRSTFKEDPTALAQILTDVGAISIGGINTTGYMVEIQKAMKEVTEYNDIELDAEHDELEKQEALDQLPNLKENSKFKQDMEDYLNNGIPVALVDSDPYEYIVNGTVTVRGIVSDSDNTTHTITATLGTDEVSQVSSDKTFSLEFNRAEGVYLNEALTINVNDGLTNKGITIKGKPIISVSNPEIFTKMVKLLESDRSETFVEMSEASLVELLDIFNTMVSSNKDTSPIVIRGLYNKTERLSTQPEGQLEVFVKTFVQSNYLEWLYENYLTATVDDFEFVGVVRNGLPVVTYENIDKLREVITDYKAQGLNTTPTVEDYLKWVDMLNSFTELDTMIDAIYDLTTTDEVTEAIQQATQEVDVKVPDWSSFRTGYTEKLKDIADFEKALGSVEKVETDYTQSSHDDALALVNIVKDVDAKTALEERLAEVQKTITAIAAIEQAELTKDETDISNAQGLVDTLKDGPKKTELQDRLNDILKYTGAREAVVKAEKDLTQSAHDEAEDLVDNLSDGQLKTELTERLKEVQNIIDAIKGVEQAELTADDSDISKAQDLIANITTEAIKSELQDRLDAVLDYADAVKEVVKAEKDLEQSTKDSAQDLVDQLPPSKNKDNLQERLDEVQRIIDASKEVDKAEISKDPVDVSNSQDLIDKVQNAEEKEKLQDRLDKVIDYIKAEEAVKGAEDSLRQDDKDSAKDLVDKLPDGPDKEELLDRLEDVQDKIDKKSDEDKATDATEKAEVSWDPEDVSDARDLVDKVRDETIKDNLNERLDAVDFLIAEYEKVKALVEKAEGSKLQVDSDTAKEALDDLTYLIDGTNAKTDALQERIDEVNHFIKADKGVTLAENSKYQRHVDEAQILIDELKSGTDKDSLQERLDKLREELINKPSDFLDRVVNGNPPITPPELSDFTNEIVYEEIFDQYLDDARDLADKTGELTKEDLIQIVRTINALEIAKRSMLMPDIAKYQHERELVNKAIQSNYPTPIVMAATASYLEDNSKKLELAEGLAELLGLPIESVLAEMESILAGMEDITSGFYSIQYVDVGTSEVIANIPVEADYGTVEVTPSVPKEGYELVDTEAITFELNKDTNGKVFRFMVKATDKDNTTTDDSADIEFTTGSYTVSYMTEDNNLVSHKTFDEIPFGDYNIEAEVKDGYELIEGEERVKYITLTEEEKIKDVIFYVKEVSTATTEDTATVVTTAGEDTALVQSFFVASLDNAYITSTQVKTSADVSHQQYLYQAARALVLTEAYLLNSTQQNLDLATTYILDNLLNGAYKEELLTELNMSNGSNGKVDLTPIRPYVPPVKPINPPTPPESNNNGGNGDGYIPPNTDVILPPDSTIEPPKEGSTPEAGTIHDVVKDKDGSLTWVIENPVENEFNLKGPDINLSIAFGENFVKGTQKLEIVWKHLGKEHYQLLVFKDGQKVNSFKAKLSLKKNKTFKYMHKKMKYNYKATPYKFEKNKFSFNATTSDIFRFSKKKKTFSDISKYGDSKDAIEELAGRLIVHGVSDTKFNPSGKITRAQFAATLTRALGLEASKKETPFKDTKGGWYEDEIKALYEAGYIKGTAKNTFSPNKQLSREEVSVILYRVLEQAEKNGTFEMRTDDVALGKTTKFSDSKKIDSRAKVAIAQLESLGLLIGSKGKVNPQGTLTRSQLAKLVVGTLKLTGDM